MSNRDKLKNYIKELMREIQTELDESTATTSVDGYQTPFAFSGKRKQDKEKADSNIKVTGYMKIKDINESTTPSDIIKDLDKAKNDLLKKVDVLVAKKKKLYSNVDITSPMSADEKKLDKDIADLFSQINSLVLQRRKVKNESVNESSNDKQKVVDYLVKKGNNKNDTQKMSSLTGYTLAEVVNRYHELRKDESTPNQKIGRGIREIRHQLQEMEKFIEWYGKIKSESELESSDYWKRTQRHLNVIGEKIDTINQKIKELTK